MKKIIVLITMVGVLGWAGVASALTQSQIDSILNLLESFGADSSTITNVEAALTGQPTGQTSAGVTGCTITTFDRNLTVGMTGDDVKCLQVILNSDSETKIADSGVGSPGQETTYFGPLTKAGVIEFQELYASDCLTPLGLTAGTGYVGEKTRTKLNAMLAVGETGGEEEGGAVITGEGLSVALASDNPAAGTLVAGQGLGDLAKYRFTNRDGSTVKVTQIKLKRIGVSGDSTLSNVYLYDGASRLTDNASVSSGYITFVNSAGIFSLAAGASKTITVKSTILASTQGQTVGVEIEVMGNVVTNASSVSGLFPMMGNLMSIAAKPSTFAAADFSATTYPSSSATIDPQNDYPVWQNTVTITNYKVRFNRLNLRQLGSVDIDDLQNFRLYVDGIQVGSAVDKVDADKYVTFDLSGSPVELKTGSRVIKVLADIIGGSYSNFQFSLRRTADVSLTDVQYGADVLPTYNSGSTFTALTTGTITISTGSVTVAKKTDSPSGNVVKDASSVKLATFTLTAAGEDVKIETLRVAIHASSSNPTTYALRNGYLLANGTQVGSTAAIEEDSDSTGYTEYTTNFVVSPGSPVTLEVYADVYDSGNTASLVRNDTIRVDIIGGNINNAQGQVSLQTLDVPSTTVSANTVTVTSGTMSLAKYSAYPNRTVVTPVTAYKLAHFVLTGNSTEAVNLSEIKVVATSSTSGVTPDKITNLYVVYGSKTSSVKATVATTSDNYTSANQTWAINETLAKSGTMEVMVYGTISTSITSGSLTISAEFTGNSVDSGDTVYSGASGADAVVVGQTIACGSGSFTAALYDGTPLSQLVEGNQTVTTAMYKFTAASDSYTIEQLTINLAGTNASKVAEKVRLYDGSTELGPSGGLAPDGSSNAAFTGLSVAVAANTTKVLTVKLQLGTVSSDYSQSGVNLQTRLTASTVRYVSSAGTAATDQPGSDTDGNSIYVYRAVPTVTKGTLTGYITNGSAKDLYQFTVAAPSTGPVGLEKITLGLAWSDTGGNTSSSLGTFKFYRGSTELTAAGLATTSVSTVTEGVSSISFEFPSGESVGAGETYTYKFRATPSNFDAAISTQAADTISIWLEEDAAYVGSSTSGATAIAAKNFIWSDISALNHATTTADWTGAYLVEDLPLGAQSWSR